ncbi:hypothetical protein ACFC40_34690, partial [Streptomyces parvus]
YSAVSVMGTPAVRLFAIRSLTAGQVARLDCADAVDADRVEQVLLAPGDLHLQVDGAVGYEEEEEDLRDGLHWKTRTLVARAAGRPFVWVDDEITGTDRSWVAVHHPGPALLHRVEPRQGLRGSDYAVLDAWLRRRAGA